MTKERPFSFPFVIQRLMSIPMNPPEAAGIHFFSISRYMEKNFYVYILASKRRGTLYIGVTSHLTKRVYEHKNGLVDSVTRELLRETALNA